MELILLGLGLVLVFEGLILALLPNRLEELVQICLLYTSPSPRDS